jgi:hypothetical protein
LVLAPKDRYAGVSIDAVNVDERTNEVWGAYMERDIEYYSYNFLQVEYDIDIPDEVFTLEATDWVERLRYKQ